MASLETLTQQQEKLNSSITNLIEKQRLVKENIDKIKILNEKKEQVNSMDHRSKKMLESKGTQIDWTRHKMYSLILFIGMLVLVILTLLFKTFRLTLTNTVNRIGEIVKA